MTLLADSAGSDHSHNLEVPELPAKRVRESAPGHDQSVPPHEYESEAHGVHVGTLWMLKPQDAASTPTTSASLTGLSAASTPVGSPPLRGPAASVIFEQVGEQEAEELAQAMGQHGSEEVRWRFATGRRCYIGWIDGSVATYGWVTCAMTPAGEQESIGGLGLSVRLRAGEAYIWDCATLPVYRGQRLYPALLSYMLGELWNEGVSRVWIGADASNLASQKGFVLAGFRPIADLLLQEIPAEGIGDVADKSRWQIRGCAGADEQEVGDARWALLGEQTS